jgi:DNA polymerase III alpha subunit
MKYARFPCGCSIPMNDNGKLDLEIDWDNFNYDCKATWDLISSGNTKGLFQIESRFGRQLAKQARVDNLEDLGNLTAIMRPGCVSGDTSISLGIFYKDGKLKFKKKTLSYLYNNKERYIGKSILSIDEQKGLTCNSIKDIFYQGKKDVYSALFKVDNRDRHSNHYDLKCTADHKLLTNKGWKELKDIKIGERVLLIKHKNTTKRSFRNICFKNYEYNCVFCDWKEGSLDVNHLEGNRNTNNSPQNLHFICPNHHRLYSEKKITKEEVLKARERYTLKKYDGMVWGEYLGNKYIGNTYTYDISVEGPNHNFIAGNVVVHNCSEARLEGKTLTQHYLDRKAGREPITYFHQSLEKILKPTYGILVYQEQAMRIAQELAGFNLMEADELRKAAGKKKADLMAKIKVKLIDGCKRMGIVTEEEAAEIWGWIEKSQRYSFNKSHAIGYAYVSYITAYLKQHTPLEMLTSWLSHSKEKQGKHKKEEMAELINNARNMGFQVNRPEFMYLNRHFAIFNGEIYFGFTEVSGVGDAVYDKLMKAVEEIEADIGPRDKWTYMDLMMRLFTRPLGSKAVKALISTGAFDTILPKRTRILYEYDKISEVTDKPLEWCIANYRSYSSVTSMLKACVNEFNFRQPKSKTKIIRIIDAIENPPYRLEDNAEFLAGEEGRLLGVTLTCSVVDSCDTSMANCNCKDFLNGRDGYTMIAVHIDSVKETTIKKEGQNFGKKMAFLSVSDNSCTLERVVVFSEAWGKAKVMLTPGNTVMLGGKKSNKDDSFVVEKVWQL